jgi:hypothetical protein
LEPNGVWAATSTVLATSTTRAIAAPVVFAGGENMGITTK